MSRVTTALSVLFVVAAASAFDWRSSFTDEQKAAFKERIHKVNEKCLNGTNYTQEKMHEEMHKPQEEISNDAACIVKCFMQNGPKAMDENGKISVPAWLPEELRKDAEECVDSIEKETFGDLCQKALAFKIKCIMPHHKHDHDHQ